MVSRKEEQQEEEADECDEQKVSTELPLDLSLQRVAMIVILYMFNFDLFSIYKGTHASSHRARYKRYLVPELKMEPDKWDKLRRPWKLYYCFTYSLFALRFASICVIQIIVNRANQLHRAAHNSSSNLGSIASPSSGANFTLAAMDFLQEYRLLEIFHNILIDHPGISLIFHTSLLAAATNVIFRTHFKYSREPFDSSLLRFAVEPKREIKRMNILLREKIAELLTSCEHYELNRSKSKLDPMRHLDGGYTFFPNCQYNLQQQQQLESTHQWYISIEPNLRPARYDGEYYLRFWLMARKFSYSFGAVSITYGILVQTSILRTIRDIRCRECSVGELLTWLDFISLAEELLVNISLGSLITHQMISIVMHAISQLDLVQELQYYLTDLLNALRHINDRPRVAGKKSTLLNEALLKTLVKTRVSMDDYYNLNLNISEQVSSVLVVFGSALILTLTAGRLEGNEFKTMRFYVILGSWIYGNVLLNMCAHIYTKMSHIEPIVCSLIAQLKMMSAQSNFTVGNELNCLIRSWDKFATCTNAFEVKNAVRPFGICLTYKMTLRMNFFVLTIAALVR